MMRRAAGLALLAGLLACAEPAEAQGETRYVSDQFEINLRTGKTPRNAIIRVLPTGAALEVLESDPQAGYTRVRTSSGAEGWVLSRYLMAEPPARDQLEAVRERLAAAEEQVRRQNQALEELGGAKAEADRLARELSDIRKASANVLAINERNAALQQSVSELENELAMAKRANEALADRSAREWFVTGAAVVLIGVLLGLILPRISWRRKSRYTDF